MERAKHHLTKLVQSKQKIWMPSITIMYIFYFVFLLLITWQQGLGCPSPHKNSPHTSSLLMQLSASCTSVRNPWSNSWDMESDDVLHSSLHRLFIWYYQAKGSVICQGGSRFFRSLEGKPAHLCHGNLHRAHLGRIFICCCFEENFWLKIMSRQDELLSWKKLLGDGSCFPCPCPTLHIQEKDLRAPVQQRFTLEAVLCTFATL